MTVCQIQKRKFPDEWRDYFHIGIIENVIEMLKEVSTTMDNKDSKTIELGHSSTGNVVHKNEKA